MSFRLLKQTFVLQRRCHYLLSATSNLRGVSVKCIRPSVLTPRQFIGNTTFMRCCSTLRKKSDAIQVKDEKIAIYDTLKTELLSKNRVLIGGLQKYMTLCEEGYNQDEVMLLLDCISNCLPYVDPLKKQVLIEQIWTKVSKEMRQEETILINYLKACRMCGLSVKYDNILIEIGSKPVVLEAILACVAEKGNVEDAKKLVEEMNLRGFVINESSYASLIRAYGNANDLIGANSVVEIMENGKMKITSVTQSQVIQAFLRNDKPEEALKRLNEVGNSLNEEQLLEILQMALKFNADKNLVGQILKYFEPDVLTDKEIYGPFKNICSELILQGKFDTLRTFISCLPVPIYNEIDDLDIYGDFALQEMILNNAPLEEIMKLVELLRTEKRNEMALRAATGLAVKYFSPMTNDFLEALSQEESLRPHYFWPLFTYNSLTDGEAGVLKTLSLMKKHKVDADTDTLVFYVLPKLATTLKDVGKGVKELEAVGVQPSSLLIPLSSHLLFQQRYSETISINSLYQSKLDSNLETLIHPLVTAFNFAKTNDSLIPVIANLVKVFSDKRNDKKYDFAGHFLSMLITNSKLKNENRKLAQLIGELSACGIKISRIAAEMLQEHLSRDLNEKEIEIYFKNFVDKNISLPADEILDNHIKHPRNMNLEELECHYVELESKGLNTRGVLRRLLQLNVREKRFDRALEVKKHCDKNNVELSPGMHAAIFEIYVKTGHAAEAGDILRKLQQRFPGFLIDDHKLIDFAALLVENGNLEEAQRVLKMRAGKVPLPGMDYITKNIWQLLNNVANVATTLKNVDVTENQTKKFFEFLRELNYCTYQNTLLGPVIKEYLNKNDLKSAVKEFITICSEHNVTPLKRHLMVVLIDASNRPEAAKKFSVTQVEAQEMLQEVMQKSIAIHGPTNTNISLIVALAEKGTEKQLRKVLIDPKARFSPDKLRKQIDYLNATGKLDALLKLAKCSRGLGHIQEQHIYNLILDTLIKENNYEAALSLFDELMADDEFKVSSDFIRNLVDLLKRNNLEVPTNVALYAK